MTSTKMVQVDIPGLPSDLNVDYRPPRVSLFPLSYRERALLRSVKREANRQRDSDLISAPPVPALPHPVPWTGQSSRFVTEPKEVQTDVSYCNHQCTDHQRVVAPSDGGAKKGKESKKEGKNKGQEGQKEGKDKGQEGQKKSKKKVGFETSDEEDSDSESEQEKGKGKGKKGGGKDEKSKDKGKGNDQNRKQASAFSPAIEALRLYPWTSQNANALWGRSAYQEPYSGIGATGKENQRSSASAGAKKWDLGQLVDNARRADEDFAYNWLAEQEVVYQQSAYRWLESREAHRQGELSRARAQLAQLSLDSRDRHLALPPPNGLPQPDANLMLPRANPNHNGYQGHMPQACNTMGNMNMHMHNQPPPFQPNQPVHAYYDENNALRLADGTHVLVQPPARPPLAPLPLQPASQMQPTPQLPPATPMQAPPAWNVPPPQPAPQQMHQYHPNPNPPHPPQQAQNPWPTAAPPHQRQHQHNNASNANNGDWEAVSAGANRPQPPPRWSNENQPPAWNNHNQNQNHSQNQNHNNSFFQNDNNNNNNDNDDQPAWGGSVHSMHNSVHNSGGAQQQGQHHSGWSANGNVQPWDQNGSGNGNGQHGGGNQQQGWGGNGHGHGQGNNGNNGGGGGYGYGGQGQEGFTW